MSSGFLFLVIAALAIYGWFVGGHRIRRQMPAVSVKQHSRTHYHRFYVVLLTALPACILILLWQIVAPPLLEAMLRARLAADGDVIFLTQFYELRGEILDADALAPNVREALAWVTRVERWGTIGQSLLVGALGVGGLGFALGKIAPRFEARVRVERIIRGMMFVAALCAIFTTLGIVLSLIFETFRFFSLVPVSDFLFGIHWSPQLAVRADAVGSSGAFGAIPLFTGTLMVTLIAMFLAVPVGLMSAVYLSEYASRGVRVVAKPALEILAGIPTVVYGLFAALLVAPALRDGGAVVGLSLSSESALAAGLVMGVMIIPFVSSLADDVIVAVPQQLRDGAAALGATQSEMIRQIILPAALPGIMSAILLAISRAIGETMIVVMAAGVAAHLTANPLESVTTVTVQIVMLLIGDQEFDSAKTLAAFALGMVLFMITLLLNILALYIVRKYREQYD